MLEEGCHRLCWSGWIGSSTCSPDSWCRRFFIETAALKSDRSFTGPFMLALFRVRYHLCIFVFSVHRLCSCISCSFSIIIYFHVFVSNLINGCATIGALLPATCASFSTRRFDPFERSPHVGCLRACSTNVKPDSIIFPSDTTGYPTSAASYLTLHSTRLSGHHT